MHQDLGGLSAAALENHNLQHAGETARRLAEKYLGAPSSQHSAERPTTSQRSRHSAAVPHHTESELTSIQRELQDMQREVTRDLAMGSLHTEMSTEINTLYEELQRAATKLEAERSLRRRIESELSSVREDRLQQTSAVVQELENKRNEIQSLRDERVELKQWLDRGAAECRRVADEVLALRQSLEAGEKTCSALKEDKSTLTDQIRSLTEQLSNVQQELEEMHHTKSVLEIRVRETQEAIRLADLTKKNSHDEVSRLESEVTRLNQRVRGAAEAETSLSSLCGACRQLIVEIEGLSSQIQHGALSDRFEKPLVYMHTQRDTAGSSDAVTESKLLVTKVLETVRRLEVQVRGYMQERQRERSDEQRTHQDELAALHREKEIQLQRYNAERQALEKRSQDLERELLTVASGVQEQVSAEMLERLKQLDALIDRNRELQQTNHALKDQNEQLVQKARRLKVDWSKVDESRVRLQQLQMELSLMSEYNEKLSNENRNLRVLAQSASGYDAAASQFEGGYQAESIKSDRTPQMSKRAFEEWKRQALNDGSSM
jgi:myosin heavy subunit